MVSDVVGRQLHDRFTRGESLSTEEQSQLDAWYAAQDRAEAGELGVKDTGNSLADLRIQIDSALAQLTAVTKRIQEIAAENDALRREIGLLRKQVPQLV